VKTAAILRVTRDHAAQGAVVMTERPSAYCEGATPLGDVCPFDRLCEGASLFRICHFTPIGWVERFALPSGILQVRGTSLPSVRLISQHLSCRLAHIKQQS
jgi:hypothetical protein